MIFSCSSLETMGFARLFPTARLRLQEFLQEQKCEQVLKTGCISGVRRTFRENLFCNLKQLSLQDFKRIGVSDTTGSWLGLLSTQPHMSSPCSSAWTEVEGSFLVNALTHGLQCYRCLAEQSASISDVIVWFRSGRIDLISHVWYKLGQPWWVFWEV